MVVLKDNMSSVDRRVMVEGCQECAIRYLACGGRDDVFGWHIELQRAECKACGVCGECVVARALGVNGEVRDGSV